MKKVSATELRNHLSFYLDLCAKEEIQITKNGEVVAVLSNPDSAYYDALYRLWGCMASKDTGEDYDEMVGQEIMRRCGY